ncbi:MAG TPA: hypothetical protein PLW32_01430 [Chitinophagaceae bacterium]|jgi:hypothetical protein|nr:hypothetical protein [Chitinophagaceae bacterium]
MMNQKELACFNLLKQYVEKENFKGWDVYDGLNSKLFQSLPIIKNNRLAKLAWIQLFKRSPINLRKITFVPKGYNNKGLGLFLGGYCNLYKINPSEDNLQKIHFFCNELIKSTSKEFSGSCWGYNFDWQARAFFQPKYTPTVVASSFVANAILDAYDIVKDEKLLKVARSTGDFILKDLNRTYDDKGNFSFSYSPLDTSVVFNASLLGSKLLSRLFTYTGEHFLLEEAKKSVTFCCNHQQANGAWAYGTYDFHYWIDNHHTAFNLECLYDYAKYSGDSSFEENYQNGLSFYLNNFFEPDGKCKYYNNQTFPVDIHAPAQLTIFFCKSGLHKQHSELLQRVLNWTIDNMFNEKKGYFYYQKRKKISAKIPYMRWAQAWMFYALTCLLLQNNEN